MSHVDWLQLLENLSKYQIIYICKILDPIRHVAYLNKCDAYDYWKTFVRTENVIKRYIKNDQYKFMSITMFKLASLYNCDFFLLV